MRAFFKHFNIGWSTGEGIIFAPDNSPETVLCKAGSRYGKQKKKEAVFHIVVREAKLMIRSLQKLVAERQKFKIIIQIININLPYGGTDLSILQSYRS